MTAIPHPAHPGIRISISRRPAFYSEIFGLLAQLEKLPLGKDILRLIDKRAAGWGVSMDVYPVCVIEYLHPDEFRHDMFGGGAAQSVAAQFDPSHLEVKEDEKGSRDYDDAPLWQKEGLSQELSKSQRKGNPSVRRNFTFAGLPHSGVVMFDPNFDFTATLNRSSPAYIMLGHELIHYLHFASGDVSNMPSSESLPKKLKKLEQDELLTLYEEARTVGLGPFKNGRISENKLREEARLPPRPYYAEIGDCENLPSLVKKL
jgi:hypothetical protein